MRHWTRRLGNWWRDFGSAHRLTASQTEATLAQCGIHIAELRARKRGNESLVSARVNGTLVWFETCDATLQAAPEAFAGLFLLPAAASRVALRIDAPVSRLWRDNVSTILARFHDWYQYDSTVQLSDAVSEQKPAVLDMPDKTALCFTGGVDSFYSLIKYREQIDVLVFVHGFDIPLDDTRRFHQFVKELRTIAESLDVELVVIRTNLRQHPVFAMSNWEITHGAALAAVGHLLRGTIDRLLISASFPRQRLKPWGSHPQVDPFWSSGHLRVAHVGDDKWRAEKLAEIANEPLVQQYLRVCWENRSKKANCCRCEKCVRTMLILAILGKLDDYPGFAPTSSLAQRVASLHAVKSIYIPVYEDFLGKGLHADIENAIRTLLRNSKAGVNHGRE